MKKTVTIWVTPIRQAPRTLHAEFEGSGNHDQYLFAQAMSGIATVAFAVCIFVPTWISILILILLGLAGLILYAHQQGRPSRLAV